MYVSVGGAAAGGAGVEQARVPRGQQEGPLQATDPPH